MRNGGERVCAVQVHCGADSKCSELEIFIEENIFFGGIQRIISELSLNRQHTLLLILHIDEEVIV